MADRPLEKILKVEQPVLTVDAEHVEVTQAPPAAEVLKVKQPLTAAEDADVLMTLGQRRVNILWEVTSSLIALSVTGSTLWIAGTLALRPDSESQVAAFVLLSNVFFSVLTAYIQKVNHSKIGGVKAGDPGR